MSVELSQARDSELQCNNCGRSAGSDSAYCVWCFNPLRPLSLQKLLLTLLWVPTIIALVILLSIALSASRPASIFSNYIWQDIGLVVALIASVIAFLFSGPIHPWNLHLKQTVYLVFILVCIFLLMKGLYNWVSFTHSLIGIPIEDVKNIINPDDIGKAVWKGAVLWICILFIGASLSDDSHEMKPVFQNSMTIAGNILLILSIFLFFHAFYSYIAIEQGAVPKGGEIYVGFSGIEILACFAIFFSSMPLIGTDGIRWVRAKPRQITPTPVKGK